MKPSRFAILALAAISTCCNELPSQTVQAKAPAACCDNADGALDAAAFIFVTAPASGTRVTPGFTVTGCSRTFESNINFILKARDGGVLATGHATGGGVDGSGPFSFTVPYKLAERQIGHLEVFAEDASDGEGFPPPRNIIPLVLNP
jgi:hypothetical protein